MRFFHCTTLTLALSAAFHSAAQAADTPEADLADITVTATRQNQDTLTSLNDVSIISAAQIERSGSASLPELLRRQAAIESVSSGTPGSQSSVFIRGTNSNHAVILIDGVRLVSGATGAAALQHIPLAQIDRIEIVRGPVSSVYGADAIGGVIQIFTKKPQPGLHASIGAGIGNRHTQEGDVAVWGQNGGLAYQATLSHNTTAGFSSQNQHADSAWSKANLDKDGYRTTAFSGKLSYDLAEGHTISAQTFNTRNQVEYDENPSGQDEERSRINQLRLSTDNRLSEHVRAHLSASLNQDKSKIYYQDGSQLNRSIDSKDKNILGLLKGRYDTFGWILGAEWNKQNTESHSTPWGSPQIATQEDFSTNTVTNRALFAGADARFGPVLTEANIRHDHTNRYGNHTTGKIALGYQISPHWVAKASYGTGFKAPTLNDLYSIWGNPKLQAETSRNAELALHYQASGQAFKLSAFHNHIDNLIVAQKNRTVNKDATIKGISAEGKYTLGDVIVRADATYQDAHDQEADWQLDRRAMVFGNIGADYTPNERLTLSANLHLHGHSWDKDWNTFPATRVRNGGYGIASVSAKYQVTPQWDLSLSGDNIFNKKYTTAYGYNTPGASVMLRSRYQLK